MHDFTQANKDNHRKQPRCWNHGAPNHGEAFPTNGPLLLSGSRGTNSNHHSAPISHCRFARWVFLIAGLYGLLVLLPQYFMEARFNTYFAPPLNHPEQFYGFIGVAVAWQFAFLLIAREPRRFRLFIFPAVLEKVSFGAATLVLYAQGRVAPVVVLAGTIDLLFAALFLLSAFVCASEPAE